MKTALNDPRNASFRLVTDDPETAAAVGTHKWDPKEHPRDLNTGEFIDKGLSISKLPEIEDMGIIDFVDWFNTEFLTIGGNHINSAAWNELNPHEVELITDYVQQHIGDLDEMKKIAKLVNAMQGGVTNIPSGFAPSVGKHTGIKYDAPLKLFDNMSSTNDFVDWFHDLFVSNKPGQGGLKTDAWDELSTNQKGEVVAYVVTHMNDLEVQAVAKLINQQPEGPIIKMTPSAQPLGVGIVPTGKPFKFTTTAIYKTNYTHNQVVAEKLTHDPPLRIRWNANWKKFVLESQDSKGDWGGPSQGMMQSLGLPFMSTFGKGDFYKLFKNQTGWTTSTNVAVPSAGKYVGILPQQTDPTTKTITFFNKLTINKWQGYDADQQAHLENLTSYLQMQGYSHPAAVVKLIKQGIAAKNVTILGTKSFPVPTNLASNSASVIDDFYASIKQSDWDSFDDATKKYLEHTADVVEDQTDEPSALLVVLKAGEGPGSPKNEMPTLSTFAVPIGQMSKTQFTNWLNGQDEISLTQFNATEMNFIDVVATHHGLKADLDEIVSGMDIDHVDVAPIVAVTVSKHQQLHEKTHKAVKPANQIGTPDTGATVFHSVNPASAKTLQNDMLHAAGNKTWTPKEIDAVATYTTSAGYQSMNAVLRNDQNRMKMFSESKLNKASSQAVQLQNAMTPLTESIKLYRGTGAHAFGFDSDHAPSIAALQALEGKIVTDRGFTSTSVVDKTGVGWDYTKKPIRIIINAPKGTPALNVSSATPGYQSEEEMILAAGTSFRIDEVRSATSAEKAKYGAGLDQIVTVTVVPRVKHPGPKKTPSSVASPATLAEHEGMPSSLKPTAANLMTPAKPKTMGTPFKFNTTTVYKVNYAPDQVVAERPAVDGDNKILWKIKGKTGKFQHWKQDPDTQKWTLVKEYGKGEAYNLLKDESGWYVAGTIGQHDIQSPMGMSVVAPTSTAKKISKYDAATIQAEYGDTSMFTGMVHASIGPKFKKNTSMGTITLKSTEPTAFKALALTVADWNKNHPNEPVNMLQAVKMIDAHLTPFGKQNQLLYEKKIVDWLGTAAGKKNAAGFINWANDEVNVVKTPGVSPVTGAGALKLPEEIGKPEAGSHLLSSSAFIDITSAQATAAKKKAMAKKVAWTPDQKSAIKGYTGGNYGWINNALRNGSTSGHSYDAAVKIQNAMYPAEQHMLLRRNTDSIGAQFNGLSYDDWQKLIGKTVIEPGFSSTAVGKSVFAGKKFHLEIEAPKGTPGAYIRGISKYPYENEYLLAAGTKFKILSVNYQYPGNHYQVNYFTIRLRVVE